jgi:hypothetical protein
MMDRQMQTLAKIGTATGSAMAAGLLGGCIGFYIVRILVERLGLVEGPPAGVLLVLVVTIFALVGVVLGFVLPFRWLGRQGTDTRANRGR